MGITVDVTKILIAGLAIIFDFVVSWAAAKIVPAAKAWLAERTTAQQRETIWHTYLTLVKAAQQLYDEGRIGSDSANGMRRIDWVADELEKRGILLDIPTLKAAVKEMNGTLMDLAGEILTSEEEATTDLDVELDAGDMEQWTMDQLIYFAQMNGFRMPPEADMPEDEGEAKKFVIEALVGTLAGKYGNSEAEVKARAEAIDRVRTA